MKQKSFLSFLQNIFGSFLGLVSVFFVSRYMGPEAMGAISSALAFVGLFSIFGDFGFGIAHYKRISEGKDLGDCIGTFIVIRIFTTLIMAIITLGVFWGSKILFGHYPIEEKYLNIFVIVFVSSLLGNLLYVITYTFAAKVEKAKESVSLISQKFVISFFRIIVALSGMQMVFLAWANLAGVLVGVLVSVFLFRNYPIGKFDHKLYKSYLLFAIPSILIGVTETVSMNLDKVFISSFAGTIQVGYYTSGQSITSILSYVGIIFMSLLLPTYSSFYAKGELENIRNLAVRVERYLSILIMPLIAFMFFYSDSIRVLVLGSQFGPSSIIIAILSLNALFVLFSQPYTSQLMAINKINLTVKLGIVVIVINIILNLVLIPGKLLSVTLWGLGSLGASISLLVSSFVGFVLYRYFSFSTLRFKPNYYMLRPLFISIFIFGISLILFRYFGFQNHFAFLLFGTAGGIFYILLMFLTGNLNKTDLIFYINLVNPKLLKNYVVTELKE